MKLLSPEVEERLRALLKICTLELDYLKRIDAQLFAEPLNEAAIRQLPQDDELSVRVGLGAVFRHKPTKPMILEKAVSHREHRDHGGKTKVCNTAAMTRRCEASGAGMAASHPLPQSAGFASNVSRDVGAIHLFGETKMWRNHGSLCVLCELCGLN